MARAWPRARRQRRQALTEGALSEILFHQVPMGIAVFDDELRLQRCNATWRSFVTRYTHTPADNVVPGKSLLELFPGSEASLRPHLRRVLSGEIVKLEGFRTAGNDIESYWDVVLTPLVHEGQVIGFVDAVTDATDRVLAINRMERSVQERTRELATLLEVSHRRADEAETLISVQQAITSRLDPDTVLQMIADEARRLTNTEMSAVYLIDGDQFELSVISGNVHRQLRGYRFPLEGSMAGRAVREQRTILVPDVSTESGINRDLIDRVGARAFIIAPLFSGDDPVGTITVANKQSGELGAEDERALTMLASGAVIALENARLFARLEQRTRELEALYRADEELYRHLRLDRVLQALVDVAVEILKADKSCLLVWNESRQRLIVRAAHGFSPTIMQQMQFDPNEGMVGQAATRGELVVVEDAAREPHVASRITDPEDIRSFMHVPIKVGGRSFGVFNVSFEQARAFGEEEKRLFMGLAQRAALVIENARLYERAQEAAAAEERNRLARELHDAVTQTLFSASLIADVLPQLWENDQEHARRRLEELRDLTRSALAEMRTLLLELRPATLTEIGLEDLLRQLAEATRGRSRMPVDLAVDEPCPLPADVQVALYRIAQESLNNVMKHSGATRAAIALTCAAGSVEMRIADDGRGFQLQELPPHSLGLSIMRERAEQIGADLELQSRPGGGTEVTVCWPGAAGDLA